MPTLSSHASCRCEDGVDVAQQRIERDDGGQRGVLAFGQAGRRRRVVEAERGAVGDEQRRMIADRGGHREVVMPGNMQQKVGDRRPSVVGLFDPAL